MSIRGAAHIAGVFEHPTREATGKSTAELHGEVIAGALADAGLTKADVDGLCTKWPKMVPPLSLADYLGFDDLSFLESTFIGGSSYMSHVGHAAAAIAMGKADVVVVSLAGRPRTNGDQMGTKTMRWEGPEATFRQVYGYTQAGGYALAARRHMHDYGTTKEQLAEIRVAASIHAQYNPDAMYRDAVSVSDVVNSRPICEPLSLLDCCVISDGGGALVIVSPEAAADLDRDAPVILGHGESASHQNAGRIDLTQTGAAVSGNLAFNEAKVSHSDIDYISIYDSFTITVLMALENLGFCRKGEGGEFVGGGRLEAPDGDLPFNTDGGGLCNNHPANQGGMTKIIEAVRQLRGEANEPVQVPDCRLALAHGTGGPAVLTGSSTVILGEEGYA
jgi:acetyl-CoA C-acetyltransferase